MRSLALFLLPTAALVGCGTKAPDQGAATAAVGYRRDIEQICFAEQRSGASEQEANLRAMVVATWLAKEIQTPEGRALLGELGPLAPADKAARLRAVAAEAGLRDCPTADIWR